MAAEELLELIGRENHRMRVTGQVLDEDGAGIPFSTIEAVAITLYDVQSSGDAAIIIDHDDGTGVDFEMNESGVYEFWIKSSHMTVIDENAKAGTHERHRCLMEFEMPTPGLDFNIEFDVLVRKVKNLG